MSDVVTRARELSGLCDPNCYGRCMECPADVVRELCTEIERLKTGFEGACYCCEPVGEMNTKLLAEIERLRDVRDSWCAAYTEARDQRDALRGALGRIRDYDLSTDAKDCQIWADMLETACSALAAVLQLGSVLPPRDARHYGAVEGTTMSSIPICAIQSET